MIKHSPPPPDGDVNGVFRRAVRNWVIAVLIAVVAVGVALLWR